MKIIITFMFLFLGIVFAQQTPLQKSNYNKITSYSDLSQYIKDLNGKSGLIRSEVIATSPGGKDLYAVYFSKDEFGKYRNFK